MKDRPNDSELIRIPAATLSALHAVLLRERGALEAAHLLRDVGLASGEGFYALLSASLAGPDEAADPAALDPTGFWARLSKMFEDLGWGRLHHEQIGEGVFSLFATDWIEARGGAGGCHLTAGLLADLLHRVAGFDLAVLEVDDGRVDGCRFVVGSPQTLGAIFDRIQEGAHYREAVQAVALSG